MNKELMEQVKKEIGEFEHRELEKGLNTIYVLDSGSEEYILKAHTNPENKIEWFQAEPLIYRLIAEKTDVPSPEIIHIDFSREKYENSFYLMEKLEGENPENLKTSMNADDWKTLLKEYGRILGKVHSAETFETHGFLGGTGGDLTPVEDAEKWGWSIEGAMGAWISIIQDKWEEPPEIPRPDKLEVHEMMPDSDAVIVHSDNRLDNLLVRDGKITGFLDWSHPRAGHSEYDLVRAEYLLIDWDLEPEDQDGKEEMKEALYRGYQETGSIEEEGFEERRQFYRFCTTLWIAAGFANWGSNMEDEAREQMREKIIGRLEQENAWK